MCIIRSPPAVYSITKHTCSGVWKHANRLTRKGWRTLFTVSKMRFSHIKLPETTFLVKWPKQDLYFASRLFVSLYLSTSSLATISPFFRALMAYMFPDFLYSVNSTWKTHTWCHMMPIKQSGLKTWEAEAYLSKMTSAENSDQPEVLQTQRRLLLFTAQTHKYIKTQYNTIRQTCECERVCTCWATVFCSVVQVWWSQEERRALWPAAGPVSRRRGVTISKELEKDGEGLSNVGGVTVERRSLSPEFVYLSRLVGCPPSLASRSLSSTSPQISLYNTHTHTQHHQCITSVSDFHLYVRISIACFTLTVRRVREGCMFPCCCRSVWHSSVI